MKCVRRIALRVVVFLLLGVVINIAVAWGCAAGPRLLWDPFDSPRSGYEGRALTGHEMLRWEWFGTTYIWSFHSRVTGGDVRPLSYTGRSPQEILPPWGDFNEPTADLDELSRQASGVVIYERRRAIAFGFPFRSLWFDLGGRVTEGDWFGNIVLELPARGAIRTSSPTSGPEVPRWLPLLPCWPGFLMNTGFDAGAVWLLIATPGLVSRVIRRRRGRCPACGYDLRREFSAGCSECGWNRSEVSP